MPVELHVVGVDAGGDRAAHARRRATSSRSASAATPTSARVLERRRHAVRAVAGRRELRHGPDRGLRGRHAGRRLGHRRLPRRRAPTASTACSSRAATRPRSPRSLRDLALDPAAPRRARAPPRARSAQRYAWPRVAGEVLEAYEDAIAMPAPRRGSRAVGAPRLRARRRRARARAAPADARAAAGVRRRRAARPRRALARRAGDRRSRRSLAALLAGFALQRIGVERDRRRRCSTRRRRGSSSGLGLMCFSMVLRGVGLARDPARRAAAGSTVRLRRRAAGHVHRRAHVRDAARPPRRAGARVRRRAADRQPAAAPAGRARDDRLADAAEHPRARRARDHDVLDRRPLHAPHGAARRRDRAAGDRRRRCSPLPALLRSGKPSRFARVAAFVAPGARARSSRCAPG